jgi:hypothetical protein
MPQRDWREAHARYFDSCYRAPDFVARAPCCDLQLRWEDLRWYAGGGAPGAGGRQGDSGRQCLRRLGVFPSAPRHFLILPRSKGGTDPAAAAHPRPGSDLKSSHR